MRISGALFMISIIIFVSTLFVQEIIERRYEGVKSFEEKYPKIQKYLTVGFFLPGLLAIAIICFFGKNYNSNIETSKSILGIYVLVGLFYYIPYFSYEARKKARIEERKKREEAILLKKKELEAKLKEEEERKKREKERFLKSKELGIKIEDMPEYEELESKITKIIENANKVGKNGEGLGSLLAQYIMFEKYMKGKNINIKDNLKTMLGL